MKRDRGRRTSVKPHPLAFSGVFNRRFAARRAVEMKKLDFFRNYDRLKRGSLVETRFECEVLRKFKASYLVDPASSHMLVSKIKPCMSKYKPN